MLPDPRFRRDDRLELETVADRGQPVAEFRDWQRVRLHAEEEADGGHVQAA